MYNLIWRPLTNKLFTVRLWKPCKLELLFNVSVLQLILLKNILKQFCSFNYLPKKEKNSTPPPSIKSYYVGLYSYHTIGFCEFSFGTINMVMLFKHGIILWSRGLMPADADYNLLDVARRLEMYGMMLYPAKVGIFSVWITFVHKPFKKRSEWQGLLFSQLSKVCEKSIHHL